MGAKSQEISGKQAYHPKKMYIYKATMSVRNEFIGSLLCVHRNSVDHWIPVLKRGWKDWRTYTTSRFFAPVEFLIIFLNLRINAYICVLENFITN
jgi:hypothetical protein